MVIVTITVRAMNNNSSHYHALYIYIYIYIYIHRQLKCLYHLQDFDIFYKSYLESYFIVFDLVRYLPLNMRILKKFRVPGALGLTNELSLPTKENYHVIAYLSRKLCNFDRRITMSKIRSFLHQYAKTWLFCLQGKLITRS